MLNEISQIQNNKYPMISILYGILEKKRQMHNKKSSMVVTRGWGRGYRGVIDLRIQTFSDKICKFWRPTV